MTAAAALALIATVQKVCEVPLIARFLQHASHGTSFTKLDDWLVDVLTNSIGQGDTTEKTKEKIDEVQAKYDSASAEEKADLKSPAPTAEEKESAQVYGQFQVPGVG